MKEKRYNQIVFCKDNYDDNEYIMFETIGQQLHILLKNGYIAVVRYNEPSLGVAVVEYENDESLSSMDDRRRRK